MHKGPLIIVTRYSGSTLTFHVDRLYAIDTDIEDPQTKTLYQTCIVLKVIEDERVTIVPVKESVEELRESWMQASAWVGLSR